MCRWNGDASGANLGAYAYARLAIPHFIISAVAAVPIPGVPYTDNYGLYNTQEATVVLCFGSGSKSKVHTQEAGTDPMDFKTGGTFKVVSAQKVTSTSISYSTPYGPSNNNIRGDATTKTTTTTTGTKNVTTTTKSICHLDVPTFTLAGLSAGVFHWTRPNSISNVVNVSGVSFGLVASINRKAKYRFHYTEKENDVQVLGLGRYTQTANGKIRRTGTKIGRTNRSIDVGLEFLYAPVVLFDRPQYLVKSSNDTIGHMEDIKAKHFGGRIRMEIRKGPISMRYELGLRPGVKAKVGGSAGEDNFATRLMGGAYILIGFGFGLGLL
jgi:hypothetical protein